MAQVPDLKTLSKDKLMEGSPTFVDENESGTIAASPKDETQFERFSNFLNELTPSWNALRPNSLTKNSLLRLRDRLSMGHNEELKSSDQCTITPAYVISMDYDWEFWALPKRNFNDECDVSRQPSYTVKNFSYNLECEQRYQKAWSRYNAQLRREMAQIVSLKQKVSEEYFTRCVLSYTTFWPPMHTKYEQNIFKRRFFKLHSPAEQKRLCFLMSTDLSYA
ncbi:hypothetical protein KR222_005401 [Zaprionus bogoriensis]|nr:hypothetical protein KR222_005401 [Zaprionus bogoriensis]